MSAQDYYGGGHQQQQQGYYPPQGEAIAQVLCVRRGISDLRVLSPACCDLEERKRLGRGWR